MQTTMRASIIGVGWAGQEILDILGGLGLPVVGICDIDVERAQCAAARAGTTAYVNWAELLEREHPEAVFVCTPPLVHRDPTLAALEQGIHVYVEKPIARTLADARAIVSAAQLGGAVCAIGYQWHGLELLDDLREVLDGQAVGLLAGRSFGPTPIRPQWFLERAQGGGNVLERASHQIDLQRAIAGEIVSVQAVPSDVAFAIEGEQGDIEDATALLLQFANGAIGSILVASTRRNLPGIYTLDVLANEATLELVLDPHFTLRGVSQGRPVQAVAQQHPRVRTVARFLEAARLGDADRVFCKPADAAGTLAVAIACERSLARGERQAVLQNENDSGFETTSTTSS